MLFPILDIRDPNSGTSPSAPAKKFNFEKFLFIRHKRALFEIC